MPIGAVSLRHSNKCCKPQTNKAQSFGHKEHNSEHKSRKAAYIAGSVGAVAALAVAAYLFRGKISELPIFKKTMELGSESFSKVKDFGKEAFNKTGELAQKTKKGLQDTYQVVAEKSSELVDKAKKLVKNH